MRVLKSNIAESEVDFNKATRRLLFKDPTPAPEDSKPIPGAGKSAAERPERHLKVKVTMNMDGDVISYFKEKAKEEGCPYQTLMNRVLKEYINGSRVEQLAAEVAEVMLKDPSFIAALSRKLSGADV